MAFIVEGGDLMEPYAPGGFPCPKCGADNRPEASRCSLCHHPIGADATRVSPSLDGVEPAASSAAGRSFSLGSLMLVIGLAAICLRVGHEDLPLGIALVIVSVLGLIRTTALSEKSKAQGRPMPVFEKGLVFLGSLAYGMVIFLPAYIVFVATFSTIAAWSGDPTTGLIVGLVVAVAAPALTYWLIRRARPERL